METLSEEENTQLLIRAGVDLSKPDYVDTGNLLDVIRRLQTRLDGNVHARAVNLIWENGDGERHIENFGLSDPYPQEEDPATLSADETYFRSRTDWVLKEISTPRA